MDSSIVILMASEEDAKELSLLESETMSHPWSEDMILNVLNNPRGGAIKAVDSSNNKIVGYINFTYIFEEMEIGNLCVDKNYRRQGIAHSIIGSLFDFAKENKVEKIFLEVSSLNDPAHRLYLSEGFKEINVRKNYYGPDDDAIIMLYE